MTEVLIDSNVILDPFEEDSEWVVTNSTLNI